MCGFFGEFLFDNSRDEPLRLEKLREIGNLLAHRGPDGEGVSRGEYFAFHHRRLAIIDIESEPQPMESRDKNIVLIYNGEVYNFKELRKDLIEKGHRFKTNTDTEVLIHGYEEWGIDFIHKLKGMFSFALLDKKRRILILGRDRIGQKPLYYSFLDDRVVFASEIKSIISHPKIKRKLSHGALYESLIFRYIPDPHTIFENIFKLLPGSIMVIKYNGYYNISSYWDLNTNDYYEENKERIAEKIIEALDSSVKMRLISDVPLGAFLSGGVDSAAIVSSMKYLGFDVLAVSVGFVEKAFDEREYARKVAEKLGINLKEHVTTPNLENDIARISYLYDEPFFDSSAIPTYHVCREARKHVTVALSGDGGDEGFAGYRRYRFDVYENKVRRVIPSFFRKYIIKTIGSLWPSYSWLPRFLRFGAKLRNIGLDPFDAYISSVSAILPQNAFMVLNPEIRKKVLDYDPLDIHRKYFYSSGSNDPLNRIQYLDIKTYLPGDILVKVDRASMGVSLEARAPFLDHDLLDIAFKIPPKYRIERIYGKALLRYGLVNRLGKEILYRKKQGFSIPLARWTRVDLVQNIEEAMEREGAKIFFDLNIVRRLWREHRSMKRDWSELFWAVLVLDKWWNRWGGDII